MQTSKVATGTGRPAALVNAVGLCVLLSLAMAAGAILMAVVVVDGMLASNFDDHEPEGGWLVAAVALGALVTASISVALAGAAHALVRGSPRADGRAALAGVLTFLVGLVYGTVVTPWFGLVLAAAGIALAVLALRTAVGAYLTRRN